MGASKMFNLFNHLIYSTPDWKKNMLLLLYIVSILRTEYRLIIN